MSAPATLPVAGDSAADDPFAVLEARYGQGPLPTRRPTSPAPKGSPPNADPFATLEAKYPAPAALPGKPSGAAPTAPAAGIVDDVRAGLTDAAHQVGEALRHPLDAVGGLVTNAVRDVAHTFLTPVERDVVSFAQAQGGKGGHAPGAPRGLPEGTVITRENTPEAITHGEFTRSGVNTLANAALPLLGTAGKAVGGAAGAVAGRVLGNAGLGAVNSEDGQRVRGAVAGAAFGEFLHQAPGALARGKAAVGRALDVGEGMTEAGASSLRDLGADQFARLEAKYPAAGERPATATAPAPDAHANGSAPVDARLAHAEGAAGAAGPSAFDALEAKYPAPASAPASALPSPGSVVTLSDGTKLRTRYRVVDAGALIPSHRPSGFQPDPRYPAGVQGRDYLRDPTAQAEVVRAAATLDPDRLLDRGGTAEAGPPLITPEGVVVAGNQRAMLTQRAAAEHPEGFASYRTALAARAAAFGVDPAAVAGMDRPVLVRELADAHTPEQLAAINRASDTPATKALRAADDGAARARALRATAGDPGGPLAHLSATLAPDETLADYLGRKDGRAFVDRLTQSGVFAPQEAGRLVDPASGASGALTEEGKLTVRRLLASAALDDPGALDGAPKSAARKLEHALPLIAATRDAVDARGATWDAGAPVGEALRVLGEAQRRGVRVRDILDQGSLLGDTEPAASPEGARLAEFLERAPQKHVTGLFRQFATQAREAAARAESGDLFGDAAPSRDGALSALLDQPQYRHAGVGFTPPQLAAAKTWLRGAFATPYASIEQRFPGLAAVLHHAGAAPMHAEYLASTGIDRVLEGLTPEQVDAFTTRLNSDTMAAKATRREADATDAARTVADLEQQLAGARAQRGQASGQGTRSTNQADALRDAGNRAALDAQRAQRRADVIQAARDAALGAGADHAAVRQHAADARTAAQVSDAAARQALDAHDRLRAQAGRAFDQHTRTLAALRTLPDAAITDDATPAQRARRDALQAEAEQHFHTWDALEGQADALHAEHVDLAEQAADAHAAHAELAQLRDRSAGEGDLRARAAVQEALRDSKRADALVADASARHAQLQAAAFDRGAQRVGGDLAKAKARLEDLAAAAAQTRAHADAFAARVAPGVEQAPWFQQALEKHRTYVQPHLDRAATTAGVDPSGFLQPPTAYLRGISERRLAEVEERRALTALGVDDASQVEPSLVRRVLGDAWADRLFGHDLNREALANAQALGGPRPSGASTAPGAVDRPGTRPGASRSGSATMSTGAAESYVNDYRRQVANDARDKVVRAARNEVYAHLDAVGRRLGPDEAPARGLQAVERTVLGADGTPDVQRWEVPRDVAAAVQHFEASLRPAVQSIEGRGWRSLTGMLTRAQIAGMPVEATSHANTLASIVASVPGEADALGKGLAAVPGLGAKAAAIREMAGLDFHAPATRALQDRLAAAGALRVEPHAGGLVNAAHHWLFGPEGIDVRGRLVLARKLLDRVPHATDDQLRDFITGKLGNYVRANSGRAVNALQDVGVSAFARFQAARIPTSIKATFGETGLPATSAAQKAGDVAGALWRGPVGYAAGAYALNRMLSGHGSDENERGHALDVDLGTYLTPQGVRRLSKAEADAMGHDARPLFLPGATLNPVALGGLRMTGLRALLFGDRAGAGKFADAGKDVTNTALGTLSPFWRAAITAATGRAPYVQADGAFMRTVPPHFNKDRELLDRAKAALLGANPAVAAFAEAGGEGAGGGLPGALAQDGQRFGGPAAIAARIAGFTLPRVATVGVGGVDNERAAEARDQREFRDALTGYEQALRRAPGPKAQAEVIDAAVRDAASAGYDVDRVRHLLEKAADAPDDLRKRKQDRAVDRWTDRTRGSTAAGTIASPAAVGRGLSPALRAIVGAR